MKTVKMETALNKDIAWPFVACLYHHGNRQVVKGIDSVLVPDIFYIDRKE